MSELLELKTLLETQGTAWEDFKQANDARLKSIEEKGYAPVDLVEKVDIINADISKLSSNIADVMLKVNRPPSRASGDPIAEQDREYKQAFDRFLRKGDSRVLEGVERKVMESWSDPDGGVLVPYEMDAIIDRVVPTISAMARIARTVTIGGAAWKKLVKTSGMAMRRVADGAAGGETTEPKYSEIEIVPYEAEIEPWVYNTTLEDSIIDLAGDLANEAAIGFAEGGASEFISGDGVGKARGITKYTTAANASYTWGKIGYIASGKSGAFASVAPADYIIGLQHGLKQQYRPGAVFLMSDATLATVRQMKDSSGAYYLWNPDPSAGFGGRLLGSPVEVDDNMPAVAANSFSIAFGNFQRGYAIVNRRGTALIRDNITAKGKTKFNFRRRFGGGVYNFEAIKLMKFAAS